MTSEELQEIRYRDRATGEVVITGYVIGDNSTANRVLPGGEPGRRQSQWSHNRVVKLRDGASPDMRYILLREALSLVYHSTDTACTTITGDQRGVRMSAREMGAELAQLGFSLEDAVSCDICEPQWPEHLSPNAKIRYEVPRRSLDQCQWPAQVIKALTHRRSHRGVVRTDLTEWMRELLEQCAEADPDWEADNKPVTHIG